MKRAIKDRKLVLFIFTVTYARTFQDSVFISPDGNQRLIHLPARRRPMEHYRILFAHRKKRFSPRRPLVAGRWRERAPINKR